MKAIITKIEPVGRKGEWYKFYFINSKGQAGTSMLPTSAVKEADIATLGLKQQELDDLFEQYETVEMDMSLEQAGRVDSISKSAEE